MKLVVAIIRAEKLAAVQKALNSFDIDQMTVSNAFGSGHARGQTLIYRNTTIEEKLLPRIKLEIAVDDNFVDFAVDAIQQAGKTGQVGDGIIMVVPLAEVVRIRTGEKVNWDADAHVASSPVGF
ncbi:MAG TPA: P-II family nitrogen regulator [Gemmataceae bacterium]|nr:P-II family nitrogen regulator [Gemmataceae bacterium]